LEFYRDFYIKLHKIHKNSLKSVQFSELSKTVQRFRKLDGWQRCTKLEEKFKLHKEFCDNYSKYEKALPIMPKNILLKFGNKHKSIRSPLVYYYDLESVLKN
jgi:hypothetical protein